MEFVRGENKYFELALFGKTCRQKKKKFLHVWVIYGSISITFDVSDIFSFSVWGECMWEARAHFSEKKHAEEKKFLHVWFIYGSISVTFDVSDIFSFSVWDECPWERMGVGALYGKTSKYFEKMFRHLVPKKKKNGTNMLTFYISDFFSLAVNGVFLSSFFSWLLFLKVMMTYLKQI